MNETLLVRQNGSNQQFLELKEVSKDFAGLRAVNEVKFNVRKGEIIGIIGPNGAGKTTLINMINGFLPVTKGEIYFKGLKLNGLPAYQICALGVARIFQNKQIFSNMSIIENVMIGIHRRGQVGLLPVMLNLKQARKKEKQYFEEGSEILSRVGINLNPYRLAKDLSAKEQTLLGIARGLACKPMLFLLDEPVAGLSIEEIYTVANLILSLRKQGLTIILIEHRMEIVMGICDRLIVLNFGQKIADDIPEKIRENKQVISAYLGEKLI